VNVSDIAKSNKFDLIQDDFKDLQITTGYTSDLLSDVMGNAPENSVLITIQAHKNTIAVAILISSNAIIICNNRDTPEDFLNNAKKEKIAVFKTALNQYQSSIELSNLLS